MSTTTTTAAQTSLKPAPLLLELPPLPFAFSALEPHIDAQTAEIHYAKHHAAYIANARKLLEVYPELVSPGVDILLADLTKVPEVIRAGVRNNVGGHVNHSFFWKLLAPPAEYAPGPLLEAIHKTFGPLDAFKALFADTALKRFGSGWAWLSVKPSGGLIIHSTANQDSPITDGLLPVIGLDVWEHAYYLKYQNRRADYVAAFWNVLNWRQAEANYAAYSS